MSYRAAVCTALTGPESIKIETRERAPLKPGEVRIAIKAAGLNFPDLLMTYGKYQFRPDPPFIPGMEFSGEIIEIADGVTAFKKGDAVMGGGKGDCIAEEAVVSTAALVAKPSALSWEEAACWRAGGVTAAGTHAHIQSAFLSLENVQQRAFELPPVGVDVPVEAMIEAERARDEVLAGAGA